MFRPKNPYVPTAPSAPMPAPTDPTASPTSGATTQPMPKAADAVPADQTNDITPGDASWATPQAIEQMSIAVANATGAGQSSAENLAKWDRDIHANNWSYDQALQAMHQKALEPDNSARPGTSEYNLAASGLSGFLGNSMVPTDAGSYQTLLSQIQNILGNKSVAETVGLAAPGSAGGSTDASGGGQGSSYIPSSFNDAAKAGTATLSNPQGSSGFTPTPMASPYGNDTRYPTRTPSDTSITGDLLNRGPESAVGSASANMSPSRIPDKAATAMIGLTPLAPFLMAGNQGQKLNHPGDVIFGNPAGGPQGPTDPNLKPTTPEEQQRNAKIVADLLANNEANGGR